MPRLLDQIKQRKELLLLVTMLELLHFSIWLDFGDPLSRAFMLTHLGVFLIWQPVWRGDAKFAWYNGVIFIFLTVVFVALMKPWLLTGWLLILTGVCGGRVVISRRQRDIYMLVLLYLVSEILIACNPMLFDIDIPFGITQSFRMLLPLLPVLMLLLPADTEERSITSVDIIYASVTMLLVGLLVAGSLLSMYISGTDYITALAETLIAIGLLLFLISWLLSPRAGFSGLSQLWLRSILNIGTPFEQWLEAIDSHFERESSPDEFIEASVWELVSLPWVSGARWRTPTAEGEYGELTEHSSEVETDQITITLYGYRNISGALYLHCKLLVQIIHNFYVAKIREKVLTQQIHLRAIHETGARITHDIKNLLQSLQAITSIIESDTEDDQSSLSQQLLRKQLPNLTQRLQLALDKLQAPHEDTRHNAYLRDWWQDLQKRISLAHVRFQADIAGDAIIPADLFDSVIDNLLENLREKSQAEPDIAVTVSVLSDGRQVELVICDTGSRIPDDKARHIFCEPIKSDSGLGIGLYQAARHAETAGYRLDIDSNRDGRVCFALRSKD